MKTIELVFLFSAPEQRLLQLLIPFLYLTDHILDGSPNTVVQVELPEPDDAIATDNVRSWYRQIGFFLSVVGCYIIAQTKFDAVLVPFRYPEFHAIRVHYLFIPVGHDFQSHFGFCQGILDIVVGLWSNSQDLASCAHDQVKRVLEAA